MKAQELMVAWQQVIKILISFDYCLGFLPTMAVYFITKLLSAPKNDVEFYRRVLYIQVVICPLMFALFLAILWFYFNLHLAILYIILVLYSILVVRIHYTKDSYVYLVTHNDVKEAEKLSKKLKKIKLISFYCATFNQ
jgi:hypothetical protein